MKRNSSLKVDHSIQVNHLICYHSGLYLKLIISLDLLMKNPLERLACSGNDSNIRKHVFFRKINWEKLEQRRIQPPFIPNMVNVQCSVYNKISISNIQSTHDSILKENMQQTSTKRPEDHLKKFLSDKPKVKKIPNLFSGIEFRTPTDIDWNIELLLHDNIRGYTDNL